MTSVQLITDAEHSRKYYFHQRLVATQEYIVFVTCQSSIIDYTVFNIKYLLKIKKKISCALLTTPYESQGRQVYTLRYCVSPSFQVLDNTPVKAKPEHFYLRFKIPNKLGRGYYLTKIRKPFYFWIFTNYFGEDYFLLSHLPRQ